MKSNQSNMSLQPNKSHQQMTTNQPSKYKNMVKLAIIGLTVALATACAELNLAVMESPVEQLKDLRDFDSDGVIEAREKCAETILGATIDNYGCGKMRPIKESIKLDIKFANDSSQIPTRDYKNIKAVADFLNKHPGGKVVIEGHTSKQGSQAHNQILSEQRANAVADILTSKFNIPTNRVSTKGYGFERLKDHRDNLEAHAINRRTLAELSGTENIDDMIWTIYTVDQYEE